MESVNVPSCVDEPEPKTVETSFTHHVEQDSISGEGRRVCVNSSGRHLRVRINDKIGIRAVRFQYKMDKRRKDRRDQIPEEVDTLFLYTVVPRIEDGTFCHPLCLANALHTMKKLIALVTTIYPGSSS